MKSMINGSWKSVVMAGQAVLIVFLLGFSANLLFKDRDQVFRLVETSIQMVKANEQADAKRAERTEQIAQIVSAQMNDLRTNILRHLDQSERMVDTVCWMATTSYIDRQKQLKANPRILQQLTQPKRETMTIPDVGGPDGK